MRSTVEYATERPADRAARIEPGRAAAPLTLGAGHHPPEFPLARLVGRGAAALVRVIGGAVADWREWRRRAAAIRELRAWDDRMLKDIGLTRGEITAAVDGRLDRSRRSRPAPNRGVGLGAPQGRQGPGRASRLGLEREQA